MMHYGSWLHQGVLDNHHYYNRYAEESRMYQNRVDQHQHQQREEESEQTGEDTHETTTPGTSCERSSSADIFRLEFAATQWSKLVTNAEGLFNKLMINNVLPDNEQDQIEQWLCLKQEYEECIASDETTSLQGYQENPRRSLERIEEVTETDEKTDESGNRIKLNKKNSSSSQSEMSEEEDGDLGGVEEEDEEEEEEEEDEEEEDEDRSDASSENPDFLEKLDEFMNKFKSDTDRIIEGSKYDFGGAHLALIGKNSKTNGNKNTNRNLNNNNNNNNDYVPIIKPIPIRNPHSRRNSMLPGSEMCNEVITFNGSFRPCNKNYEAAGAGNPLRETPGEILGSDEKMEAGKRKDPPLDPLAEAMKNGEIPEPFKALKTLSANNEAKRCLVKKIQSDVELAQRRIAELQSTIRMKEGFIEDMNRNSEVRTCAKEKFQRKRNKLEEEYYSTRSQLAQAENASMYEESGELKTEGGKKDVQMYKTMAIRYEKRLMDIEMMKKIAGDSAKKVLELESSLNTSRRQMEKLKRQLRKEEERKRQLERELTDDEERMRRLEEKYNVTESKLLRDVQQSESDDERILLLRSKNEDAIEDKKNLTEIKARISHLDQVLKEKALNLEGMKEGNEKEALRHDIRSLRKTRECLIEAKCSLDDKLQKERVLGYVDDRTLLACGESIDVIDAIIEHKNEMICGREAFDADQWKREKCEKMSSQLEKLSVGEILTLFYKYFFKVIDLKETSKKLDVQTSELERQIELQDKRMLSLSEALQRTKLEAERKFIEVQRDHQEKLHVIFRHMAEENSGPGSGQDKLEANTELGRLKRENKLLKRRLTDFEAMLKTTNGGTSGGRTAGRKSVTSPPRIVQQELKKIGPKTRVTREGNKLIIQQMDSDKRKT